MGLGRRAGWVRKLEGFNERAFEVRIRRGRHERHRREDLPNRVRRAQEGGGHQVDVRVDAAEAEFLKQHHEAALLEL